MGPMIYISPLYFAAGTTAVTATPADISSTGTANTDVILYAPIGCGGRIMEAGFIVTEVPGTSAPVITVSIRPSPVAATTTNARTVDTLTIPITATIGDVFRNGTVASSANSVINPGEVLVFTLTTIGGDADGEGYPYAIVELTTIGIRAAASEVSKPFLTNAIGTVNNVLS